MIVGQSVRMEMLQDGTMCNVPCKHLDGSLKVFKIFTRSVNIYFSASESVRAFFFAVIKCIVMEVWLAR